MTLKPWHIYALLAMAAGLVADAMLSHAAMVATIIGILAWTLGALTFAILSLLWAIYAAFVICGIIKS